MRRKASLLSIVAILIPLLHAVDRPPAAAPAPSQPPAKLAAAAAPAAFPSRPVEIIVAAAAGGGQDIYTRIVAKHSEKFLGRPIVVSNVTGGGAVAGFTKMTSAAPNGYTLGSVPPTGVLQPFLIKGVTYTPKSFKWIIQHSFDPTFLVVKKGGKYDMPMDKFIEYAKAHPKEIRVGIGNPWSAHDFGRAVLEKTAGIQFERIPFDSGTNSMMAMLGNHIDSSWNFFAEIQSQYQAGNITIIGAANSGRWELTPDAVTFQEKGYDVVFGNWRALAGPKDTPDAIIQILHDAFKKALDAPELKNDLKKAGYPVVYRGPADLQKYIDGEVENRYGKAIKEFNIQPR